MVNITSHCLPAQFLSEMSLTALHLFITAVCSKLACTVTQDMYAKLAPSSLHSFALNVAGSGIASAKLGHVTGTNGH